MKQAFAKLYKQIVKKDVAFLDYIFDPKPRYTAPHPELYSWLRGYDAQFKALLQRFTACMPALTAIKNSSLDQGIDAREPFYNNGFLPGLDIIALYGMLAEVKPRLYYEIGSGNSTKVARLAIAGEALSTTIVSLDPQPRAEINALSDEIIREPLQSFTDYGFITGRLEAGDILFYDGTHIAAANSDVTAFFLDILPRLKKGVIVQIHDIYLPYDYPQLMCDRFYNEQYLLAAFLLANPKRYEPVLPAYYVYEQKELLSTLDPIFGHPKLAGVERHGGSFWLRIND